MLGTGFAFALLPVLREAYGEDDAGLREAVGRHSDLFNSHPYLAPMALGAVAALERDRAASPLIERFKAAVRGPLGALGDRLVWAAWLPATLLLALVLYSAGVATWAAAGAFLLVYNVGHLGLRIWGFRLGLKVRNLLGEPLKNAGLVRLGDLAAAAATFLLGVLVPLLLLSGIVSGTRMLWGFGVLGALSMGLGAYHGAVTRKAAVVLLCFATFAILGYGLGR